MLTVKYTTRRGEQTHSRQEITRDDQNNILANATYCYGPRGAECKRDNLTQTERWYVLDGLGSVLAEVDKLGQAKANHRCDVWGNDRLLDPGDPKSKHAFVGNLGHTSGDTPGLIYMRARWYDPTVGRFISEDPGKDGANWYAYCRSNPVGLVDLTGRSAWGILLEVLGAAALIIGGLLLSAEIILAGAIVAIVGALMIVGGIVLDLFGASHTGENLEDMQRKQREGPGQDVEKLMRSEGLGSQIDKTVFLIYGHEMYTACYIQEAMA